MPYGVHPFFLSMIILIVTRIVQNNIRKILLFSCFPCSGQEGGKKTCQILGCMVK
ncbi:hypothetical protein HMPREF1040_1179 [Megasphaera sp. UPII 135-E]|nr:hypothetical protein HMPREF1040_1179 [Megasphaera sp. UPII 135-E]